MRWGLVLPCTALAVAALGGCPPDDETQADIGGGGTDAGVDCPMGPTAMLDLVITAASGPVPPDTTLEVSWSAGAEPPFALDDPKTWSTAADGANVVCDVDPEEPAPSDLPQLVCHLWTSGATHVKVEASGYVPYESTLKPKYSAACKGPVPTTVAVTLAPFGDAGPGM